MTVLPDRDALDDVLRDRLVEPHFQPVVDLDRDAVVAFEALARVTSGQLRTPEALFASARRAGRLLELDWLCREQAVGAARAAGLRHPLSLFINAEPETLLNAEDEAARWRSFGDLRCYAELTERDLAARPAALLRTVDQVREQDWGIALDDVGADPASLALLPVVRPDVIKLDLRLLQDAPAGHADLSVARTLHAALSQAADTGAVVVAEGVETEQHLDLARAYGVQYAQGYLLGRPAPLPEVLVSPRAAVPLLPRVLDKTVVPSPFAVVAGRTPIRTATPAATLEVARQLLAQAVAQSPEPVVLLCVNDAEMLAGPLPPLLAALAGRALLAVTGTGPALVSAARCSGTQAGRLDDDDPARDDFDVVVLGAQYSAAVVARRGLSPHAAGGLDMALTFDRELVCQAAHALLRRTT